MSLNYTSQQFNSPDEFLREFQENNKQPKPVSSGIWITNKDPIRSSKRIIESVARNSLTSKTNEKHVRTEYVPTKIAASSNSVEDSESIEKYKQEAEHLLDELIKTKVQLFVAQEKLSETIRVNNESEHQLQHVYNINNEMEQHNLNDEPQDQANISDNNEFLDFNDNKGMYDFIDDDELDKNNLSMYDLAMLVSLISLKIIKTYLLFLLLKLAEEDT